MDVVSICSLPVAKLVWQAHSGAYRLTVVCKATFLLSPPMAELAPEQDEPNEDDNHWNDDARRSLYSASDLAPFKPRADVTLVGHAFAPGGASVRSLVTRLRVGSIDKSIEVYCDRIFRPDGTLDEGPPFKRMQVVYERAAGGPDTTNPVGMRVDAVDPYGRIAIPNVQLPGRRVTLLADLLEPVGFGPVAPNWPTRRGRIGRAAETWSPRDISTKPLPEDLDPSFFNIAPPDQQLDVLHDDELIMLENLHRDHMILRVHLPGIHPIATVERPGRPSAPLQMRCDTLWIDTDRSRCALTWRGQLPLDKADEPGRVIVSMEEGPGREWRRDRPSSEPPSSEEPSLVTSRLNMVLVVGDSDMGDMGEIGETGEEPAEAEELKATGRFSARPSAMAPPSPPVPAIPKAKLSPPAAPAAPAGPVGRTARGGTAFGAATGTRVCSLTNRPGDKLVATLQGDVTGPDGVVFPSGSSLVLELVRFGADDGRVELLARGVSVNGTFYPIVAEASVENVTLERHRVKAENDGRDKAVKGAIAGAIIGQILGRNTKSTIIGAAGGAAAGAAASAMNTKEELCLPVNAGVRLRLTEAVTVH